jgi:hypothetical protein
VAKPSGDHIPPGGFVFEICFYTSGEQHEICKAKLDPIRAKILEEMLGAKKSAAEIGLRLDRREEAVYARVQRLRLKRLLPEGLSFSRRTSALMSADCGLAGQKNCETKTFVLSAPSVPLPSGPLATAPRSPISA